MGKDLFGIFEEQGILENTKNDELKAEIAEKAAIVNRTEADEKGYRNLAVKLRIIPNDFIDASFDIEKIRDNISQQRKREHRDFTMRYINQYSDICYRIINQIKYKEIPNRSYIIGAPNGCGKQSFVTDCLISSLANGWLTVPYISLNELAGIAAADEEANYRGLMSKDSRVGRQVYSFDKSGYVDPENAGYLDAEAYNFDTIRFLYTKRPQFITNSYSWSEYINAPVLFVFFSGINNRRMEAHLLKSLLSIRSAKGYPTIAMTSDSIVPYEKDTTIANFWKDIVISSTNKQAVIDEYINDNDKGRALHISCYKYMEERL